jgi:carbamoyl-phosphate synthase small subunit
MSLLVLESGEAFAGESLGVAGRTTGEIVFVTAMTGYQEVLTDPSYAGQIVVFTYPLIGNYGINEDDFESVAVRPRGIVVHQACGEPSNWRSRWTLPQYLADQGVVAIQGVDTRAVTCRIREGGAMMATITSDETVEQALARLRGERDYGEQDYVSEVSTDEPFVWDRDGREPFEPYGGDSKRRVVVLDCGTKFNILRRLAAARCRSLVMPCDTSAEEILSLPADGIVLSPGPGDPERLSSIVKTVQGLMGKKPILGICLGHQLSAIALGGRTEKLKFGHHGSNHPVRILETGCVNITSQNHGYAVVADSLSGAGAEITEEHVTDGSVEGFRHRELRLLCIQYHPEAAPGPWDSRHYFPDFMAELEG